jgi:FlaA1/EpsC-like NDP-sugar epimerase
MTVRIPLVTPKRVPVLGLDIAIFFVAYLLAHVVRMDPLSERPGWILAWSHFQKTVVLVILAKAVVFFLGGTYRGLVQYATLADLVVIARNATVASLAAFFFIAFFQDFRFFSRGVFAIDWMITIGLVSASRVFRRLAREGAFELPGSSQSAKRLVIVGAGRAGVAFAKDLKTTRRRDVELVGFVDDDPDKQNSTLLGRPILGMTSDLPVVIKKQGVEQVVVAIASATPRDVQRIAALTAGVNDFRVIPSLDAILSGRVPIGQTLALPTEAFLQRESVDLAEAELDRFLAGKRVLITGAGGSIGGELARQLARSGTDGVAKLILLDSAETPLYDIERQIRAILGPRVVGVLTSVRDTTAVARMLAEQRPDIVLHAAALKHVPLCEAHPLEAVLTNTLATARLADACESAGVERFILVSTDKAVAPASVMGATKRAAETYVQRLAQSSRTRFATVRFGNVLGSNGSVLALFHEQIARGGPVTVTDARATRFLMTIPEACGLILQATRIAAGGEVYVLEMGDPVSILEFANNLIRLYGYDSGRDIEIRFIGLRPGEKLHESLLDEGERAEPSGHPKILRVAAEAPGALLTGADLQALQNAIAEASPDRVLELLSSIVPTYRRGPRAAAPEPELAETPRVSAQSPSASVRS